MASKEKLIQRAREFMEPSEQVIAAVAGNYMTKVLGRSAFRKGIIIASDRRLILYGKKMFGYNLEVVPYSQINSIEMSKGYIMGRGITFMAMSSVISLKRAKGDVEKFVSIVRDRIGKGHNSPSSDIADQIQKLHDMKERGVLTDQEFQSKKKQMLGL